MRPVEDRCWHVWASAHFAPGDMGVALLCIVGRDVAASTWPDCEDRLDGPVAAGDEEEVLAADGGWHCHFRFLRQTPQFRASLRVVAACVLRSVRDEFDVLGVAPDYRRTPRGDFIARRGPNLFTVLHVERCDERVPAQIALKDCQPIVDERGVAEAPFVFLIDGEA